MDLQTLAFALHTGILHTHDVGSGRPIGIPMTWSDRAHIEDEIMRRSGVGRLSYDKTDEAKMDTKTPEDRETPEASRASRVFEV